MPFTIDEEAKQFARSPFDISKMGPQYKTENELFSFPSPTLETIEKNLFFLLRNSTFEKFEPKYRFRPDYLSYDRYGTVVLWQLLLYVNGVFSMEDFDIQEIVIPSLQAVIAMNEDNFPRIPPEEQLEINW